LLGGLTRFPQEILDEPGLAARVAVKTGAGILIAQGDPAIGIFPVIVEQARAAVLKTPVPFQGLQSNLGCRTALALEQVQHGFGKVRLQPIQLGILNQLNFGAKRRHGSSIGFFVGAEQTDLGDLQESIVIVLTDNLAGFLEHLLKLECT
jgi:hypothetical protein